jgi:small subunit ribosomal protein S20
MANTSSAKKAQRAALRRRVFNLRRKKTVKDDVKTISKLIQTKNVQQAVVALPALQKAVDKAAKTGVLKANTAARMKSRIAKRIQAIAK